MTTDDFMNMTEGEQELFLATIRARREIREDVKNVQSRIASAQMTLSSIQEKCPHHGVTKTHCSDTGNYSASDNRYWTVFECPDCEKIWSEDGSV